MKSKLSVILSITFATQLLLAQSNSKLNQEESRHQLNQEGFRIGVIRPNLDLTLTSEFGGFAIQAKDQLKNALGLTFGYASLPTEDFGWSTSAALMQVEQSEVANLIRIEGNLAYSLNEMINFKIGPNLIKFTKGDQLKDLDPTLGFQAGVGLQITPNFGMELGYVEMKTTGKSPITINKQEVGKASTEVKMSGFEIGLHGTF